MSFRFGVVCSLGLLVSFLSVWFSRVLLFWCS